MQEIPSLYLRVSVAWYSVGDEPTCEFHKCKEEGERGIEAASLDLVRMRERLSGKSDGDGNRGLSCPALQRELGQTQGIL